MERSPAAFGSLSIADPLYEVVLRGVNRMSGRPPARKNLMTISRIASPRFGLMAI
jgi:hypothetical protein